MSILEQARRGLALIQEGRKALTAVSSAVQDGKAALSANDAAELEKMLERERVESHEAHDALDAAITKTLNP